MSSPILSPALYFIQCMATISSCHLWPSDTSSWHTINKDVVIHYFTLYNIEKYVFRMNYQFTSTNIQLIQCLKWEEFLQQCANNVHWTRVLNTCSPIQSSAICNKQIEIGVENTTFRPLYVWEPYRLNAFNFYQNIIKLVMRQENTLIECRQVCLYCVAKTALNLIVQSSHIKFTFYMFH